jgi:NADH-quinone oxidoreductase subunit I
MGFPGKGLFEGMAVTARNFVGSYFDKELLTTIQYPEERMKLPENSRSFPFLVFDNTADAMRCVACKICETDCPPQCIYIVMDRDEKGKPRQRPRVFDIDISVCMQCQICVEVCPFDAIKMDNDYEKSQYGRFDDLVEHLPDLLKSNEYYNKIKPTEAKAVDAKLKAAAAKKAKPAAPAPKPVTPAPAPAAKPAIPDDAPFTPEQREWLAKYLTATPVAAAPTTAGAQPSEVAPAAGNWAWHDPALGLSQRMDLAKSASLADKVMAAMAQTDCHACGYDCRGYADAIAAGSESDLSLCLPGEAETAKKLEELMKAAGKL